MGWQNENEDNKKVVSDRLEGKESKADVEYRPAEHGKKTVCAECENYLFPGNESSNCRKVAGIVYASDTCELFMGREAENGSKEGSGPKGTTQKDEELNVNATTGTTS